MGRLRADLGQQEWKRSQVQDILQWYKSQGLTLLGAGNEEYNLRHTPKEKLLAGNL